MPDWSEEIRDAANELDQLFRQRHTMKDVEHVLHRLLDRALKRPEAAGVGLNPPRVPCLHMDHNRESYPDGSWRCKGCGYSERSRP